MFSGTGELRACSRVDYGFELGFSDVAMALCMSLSVSYFYYPLLPIGRFSLYIRTTVNENLRAFQFSNPKGNRQISGGF
jgi:hypothetical protein